MAILLKIVRCDVDGGVEMIIIQVHFNVQKRDLGGGGVPKELDGIVAIEALKEGHRDHRVGKISPSAHMITPTP